VATSIDVTTPFPSSMETSQLVPWRMGVPTAKLGIDASTAALACAESMVTFPDELGIGQGLSKYLPSFVVVPCDAAPVAALIVKPDATAETITAVITTANSAILRFMAISISPSTVGEWGIVLKHFSSLYPICTKILPVECFFGEWTGIRTMIRALGRRGAGVSSKRFDRALDLVAHAGTRGEHAL